MSFTRFSSSLRFEFHRLIDKASVALKQTSHEKIKKENHLVDTTIPRLTVLEVAIKMN